MNRSNTWKLFFTALLTAVGISLILPFEDRPLGEYALSQVTSDANASNHAGHEKFSEVIDNLRLQLPEAVHPQVRPRGLLPVGILE